MDTAQLKKFAQEARKSLMGIVEAKLGVVLAPDSIARRENQTAISALEGSIKELGQEQVIEKVAYTWFNRFCALRFMDSNHYTKIGIVSPVEGQTQPEVLAEAKMGYYDDSVVNAQTKDKINRLLNSSQDDAYKTLLVAYCNFLNKQLPFMFERINDYTELLMPDDLLSTNSVLSQTVAVLDKETCKDVEVIGWLYQYYISEKKDEVFANLKKGKKISKENVPAATQIFTPKWIVKYMVENSVGKLWLESHPDENLKSNFKYYLESAEQEDDVKQKLEELKNKNIQPQEIKVLDPACGSGHILVVAFSVLFEIYKSQGWQENEIPELILRNNLYGLDICDRAAQMAQFAVMMKAREYDRNIFNKISDLHICSIKDTNWIDSTVAKELLKGAKDEKHAREQISLLQDTFRDAKEYGSIIDVRNFDFEFWDERISYFNNIGQATLYTPIIRGRLWYSIKQAKIMQQQYECVIANPPYMGSNGMSSKLSEFVKTKYPDSKGDMFAVFKEVIVNHTKTNYYSSTINQHSWMFLSSYENLRKWLLNNTYIDTMVHLGTRAFEELSGDVVQTTTYITRKIKESNYNGRFVKLTQYPNAKQKEIKFLEMNSDDIYCCKQNGFQAIPGEPIAYWAGSKIQDIFRTVKPITEYVDTFQGIITGDNNKFLRLWYEVNNNKIPLNIDQMSKINLKEQYWIPYNKGGGFRKWYGNQENVVNWKNGPEDKTRGKKTFQDYYLKEYVSWTYIATTSLATRYYPNGFLWDVAGSGIFPKNSYKDYLLYFQGLLGSVVGISFLQLINPTMNFQVENIALFPTIIPSSQELLSKIINLIKRNNEISKIDWDCSETSWDFESHPLIKFRNKISSGMADDNYQARAINLEKLPNGEYKEIGVNPNCYIQDCYYAWEEYKKKQFEELKHNEEELNKLFIEIYGLQDEMTPEVNDENITLKGAVETEKDCIKSLLSYAVGCMFGRYSLDQEGLVFAGGEFDRSKYKSFEADEDGIIPILSEHYFSDDITERFKKFLKVAFGEIHYEENMDYIATVLGKKTNETADDTIRNYFLKDFYNDHVKLYQKRPIYWLFSSKNGNFNTLIYLHRYNRDTVNRILNNYLREYNGKLVDQAINNNKHILTSGASDKDKSKAQKEIEIAQKIVNEITDYERDIIYPLAIERKEINLDDGVNENYLKFGKALKDIGLKAKK